MVPGNGGAFGWPLPGCGPEPDYIRPLGEYAPIPMVVMEKLLNINGILVYSQVVSKNRPNCGPIRDMTRPPLAWMFIGLLVPLASASVSHGAADPTDVVQLRASAALAYDSNIYRIPNVSPLLFRLRPDQKSDWIKFAEGGGSFKPRLGRQNFTLDGAVNHSWYANSPEIDYTGGNATAAWQWVLGNYWAGDLGMKYRRYLGSFADEIRKTKNLVDASRYYGSAGWRLHPAWKLTAKGDYYIVNNEAQTRTTLDTRTATGTFLIDYMTATENTVGALVKFSDIEYPDRDINTITQVDKQLYQTDLQATIAWRLTGQSRLDGRLGYTSLTHALVRARDFSGPTGRLDYTWTPTGKLGLKANAWRELVTWESENFSYYVSQGLSAAPSWAATSKVSVQGFASYEQRDYRGNLGALIGIVPERVDELSSLRVGASYAFDRNAELGLQLEAGQRDSNIPLNNYRYHSGFAGLRVSF